VALQCHARDIVLPSIGGGGEHVMHKDKNNGNVGLWMVTIELKSVTCNYD
jgi:hypothetical protein